MKRDIKHQRSSSNTTKSTVINELINFWIFNSPYKIGIFTLEFSSGLYGKVLLSRHLSKKLELMTNEEQIAFLDSEEVDKEMDRLFINEEGLDRFYLIEDRGGNLQQAMDQMEKLIIGCNCKVIVIDPLQDLFAGATFDDEAKFMTWQKVMIKLYKVVFINICHTRKSNDDSKTGSNGAMISEESIQGSSSIYKSANINLLLTRNKLAEDALEKNTTKIWMSKNRTTGVTGLCASLIYHNKSNTLYEVEDYKELFPEDFAVPIPDDADF